MANTSTVDYQLEHESIFSLPRKSSPSAKIKTRIKFRGFLYIFFSVPLRSSLSILNYIKTVFMHYSLLSKTRSIKNSFNGTTALLIGNGPSQGFLNQGELDKFQSGGGVTICVNYWNRNTKLSGHIPSWLVVSDPDTFDNPFFNLNGYWSTI